MRIMLISLIIILMGTQYLYAAYPTSGTSQDSYCQVPPYLTQNVKPNINLVLDFSGSMQSPTYLPCPQDSPLYDNKVRACGTFTITGTSYAQYGYNTATDYYGYFKNEMYYKYNSTNGYFEEQNTTCSADRKGSITSNCLSGNLLNWLSTSRSDVLRKILTGGRTKTSTTDVLETEGAEYTMTDTSLHCVFTVSPSDDNSPETRRLSVTNESGYTCGIGTFSNYDLDVKTTTPNDIKGIINSMYPNQADLELLVYNTTVGRVYRVGKNKPLGDYLNAVNTELAYNGTPTGEALREAKYYFQQSSNLTSANETVVLGSQDSTKDPYYETGTLPAYCRKSFVLLISDGEWNGSVDPAKIARDMRKDDMRPDGTNPDLPGKQNVTTYAVYAFGDGDQGRQAMITTAIFGGYDDNDKNGWPYPFTNYFVTPSINQTSSLKVSYPLDNCKPSGTWDEQCSEWDNNRSGLPYNFFEANEGSALQQKISDAVKDILGRVTSGTAASVLGNNDNSGAILLQALYFPDRTFGSSTRASWTGELQSLWYYIDPSIISSKITIREDTVQDNKLKLTQDKVAIFDFNGTQVDVNLYADANGDGAKDSDTADATVSTDNLDGAHVKALWRAGYSLWSRLPTGTGGRTVYTNNISGAATDNNLIPFSAGNRDILKPFLDVASNNTDAENVINYTLGADLTSAGFRNRTVSIGGESKVWKLGDIINSTPKMLSGLQLNTYNNSTPGGYDDDSYDKFVHSNDYKNRGVAFVGANDGMLHAFKMGRSVKGSPGYVSEVRNADGSAATELGKELWAYIPKNVLPYLKHLGNPSYRHLFYVDSTPTLIDASIGQSKFKTATSTIDCDPGITGTKPYYTCAKVTNRNSGNNLVFDLSGSPTEVNSSVGTSWRTVLIGSMGWGGATRNYGASCTDCVKNPIDGTGYSSYFALDVTNPESPQFLWEFSHPRLGFSSVHPAVVRIKDPGDDGNPKRNGRWYVVLASGPTGPIDTGTNQMKAYSDQSLSIFVLDLKTGTVMRTFSPDSSAIIEGVGHTQVSSMPLYAFGGTFSDASIDTDKGVNARNYSDDAVYLGYVRKDTTAGSPSLNKFAKGGVLRILTGDDANPANWKASTVIDGIGPVTSAVTKLQDRYRSKNLWLYFGTGRYFYKIGSIIDEDYSGQQEAICGIKEPCYSSTTNDLDNVNCTDSVNANDLTDQTSSVSSTVSASGWKINLAEATGSFNAKRIITNPVGSTVGVLFLTAFKPSAGVCTYGGATSLWALKYDTGGAVSGLRGQALIQLSTGAFAQIDLSNAFVANNGRESDSVTGVTSRDEPPIISNANHFPSRKILHIQER